MKHTASPLQLRGRTWYWCRWYTRWLNDLVAGSTTASWASRGTVFVDCRSWNGVSTAGIAVGTRSHDGLNAETLENGAMTGVERAGGSRIGLVDWRVECRTIASDCGRGWERL